MKLFFYCFLMAATTLSCSAEKTEEVTPTEEKKATTIVENGLSKTFYPSGKIQMEGKVNAEGEKHGTWTSYFENGQKNSESIFSNGLNNGYSMVWYPNGVVRYFGDYKDGKQVGEWSYFDENGKLTTKKTF